MKTYVVQVLTAFLLFSGINNTAAQFTASANSDFQVSSGGTFINSSGTDIAYIGGVDIQVNVWDGDDPGISWDNYNGNVGILSLARFDAYKPDVAWCQNANGTYAIVSYFSYSIGSVYYEFFEWTGTALTSTYSGTLYSYGYIWTDVNVDANFQGDFAIVFDWDSSSTIIGKLITGTLDPLTGIPALNFSTPISFVPPGNPIDVWYPDVTLWDSVATGTEIAYISYWDSFSGDIVIQEERWININNSSPAINYTIFDRILKNGILREPRIACANNNSDRYHISVSYLELFQSPSEYHVMGYTYCSGSSQGSPVIFDYTDGSTMLSTSIYLAPEHNPVVMYDASGNIYFGWIFNNSLPVYPGLHANHLFPVIVKCDIEGVAQTSTYWEVPASVSTFQYGFSIAGRHSTGNGNVAACFWDNISGDVSYKAVATPSTSFRLTDTNDQSENELYQIQVIDLQGRLIFQSHNIDAILNLNENKLIKPGIYILRKVYKNKTESEKYYQS